MEGKDPTQRWIVLGLASSRFPVLLYVSPEISQGVHEQFLWELSQGGSWVDGVVLHSFLFQGASSLGGVSP